jgi:hypothetical protein
MVVIDGAMMVLDAKITNLSAKFDCASQHHSSHMDRHY